MGFKQYLTLDFQGGDDYGLASGGSGFYNEILEFSPESESWSAVAMMGEERAAHAISVVNFEDYAEHCDFSRSGDEPRAPAVRPANRQHMGQKQKRKRSKTKGIRVKV